MQKQRNLTIDALKGLAIIAVALYHFGGGILQYGYLGVDVFFVIGGFLLVKQLTHQFTKGEFNYWSFVFRKIVRLWPLIILAGTVSIIAGYFLMLPDNYENLAESAIAASAFSENILECITTKNYWDIVNMYKPLMHLWYVGVLMQSYVVLPLIYFVFVKAMKDARKGMLVGTTVVTTISLIVFLLPFFTSAQKFYYPPFRLFELAAGGLLCFFTPKPKNKRIVGIVAFILLLIMLGARGVVVSSNVMVLITVVTTLIVLDCSMEEQYENKNVRNVIGVFAAFGKRSYSIYIWHQVVIAFLFYSFFPKQSVSSFLTYAVVTVVLSLLSYHFIEIPLGATVKNKKKETVVILGTIVVAGIICSLSFLVYMHAGVVRDVPELNINKDKVHRNMHAEYCDRPYSWDRDFEDGNKPHILVLGNSFGRDWANVLYEHNPALDISYCYYTEENLRKRLDRVEEADFVFYAISGYDGIPDYVLENIPEDKLYIIGNKNYGESNGIIYAKRFSEDYFDQTVELDKELIEQNKTDTERFGDHFINLMAPIMKDETNAYVFSDDHKYISQDCRHLTQMGAQFYARTLDIDGLLNLD